MIVVFPLNRVGVNVASPASVIIVITLSWPVAPLAKPNAIGAVVAIVLTAVVIPTFPPPAVIASGV